MIRDIVIIDEEKCDGCGLCVPACHEGALKIVNGKARLVADRLCDGLGACLGHCPRGAIRVIKRVAEDFDEQAVAAARPTHVPASAASPLPAHGLPVGVSIRPTATSGCPGSRLVQFADGPATDANPDAPVRSQLTHWPVQLRLLSPDAPVLHGARLLIAADCVPVAYGDFQSRLLRGRAVMIGCPKFDDLVLYVERLTPAIRNNRLREIVVARMEVPCCGGILHAVLEARARAAVDVPVFDVVIGVRGPMLSWEPVPVSVTKVG